MQREAHLCSACWARDLGRLQTACRNPGNCKGLCEALARQLHSIWCVRIPQDRAQLPCAALPQSCSRRSPEVLSHIRCTYIPEEVRLSTAFKRLNDGSLASSLTLASSSKLSLRWVIPSLPQALYLCYNVDREHKCQNALAQWARGRLHPRVDTSKRSYFWHIFRYHCRSTSRVALALWCKVGDNLQGLRVYYSLPMLTMSYPSTRHGNCFTHRDIFPLR